MRARYRPTSFGGADLEADAGVVCALGPETPEIGNFPDEVALGGQGGGCSAVVDAAVSYDAGKAGGRGEESGNGAQVHIDP